MGLRRLHICDMISFKIHWCVTVLNRARKYLGHGPQMLQTEVLHRLHWHHHDWYQFGKLVASVKEALVEILLTHKNTAAMHETDNPNPAY